MIIFYTPNPTQHLNLTTTLLTMNKHMFNKLINWSLLKQKL